MTQSKPRTAGTTASAAAEVHAATSHEAAVTTSSERSSDRRPSFNLLARKNSCTESWWTFILSSH